jgi:hypothetical protein
MLSLLLSIIAVSTAMLIHDPESFQSLSKRFVKVCSNPEYNRVVERKDGSSVHYPVNRNWSVEATSMLNFVGISDTHKTKPICNSLDELLVSASQFTENMGCIVPWVDREEICSTIGLYTHVHFLGDSLMRHTWIAYRMLLTEDLMFGTIFRGREDTYESCMCDGQFSEYIECRRQPFEINFNKPFPEGLICTGTPGFSFPRFSCTQFGHISIDGFCSDSKLNGVLILQGGAHLGYTLKRFIKNFRSIITAVHGAIQSCPHDISQKLRIIVMGSTPTSARLASIYSLQEAANIIRYNKEVKDFIQEALPGSVYLDTFNVSMEAIEMGRTSDGAHFLTDINMMRVMLLVNIMHELPNMPPTTINIAMFEEHTVSNQT